MPAQFGAAEAAIQFDHATAGEGTATGEGEILLHIAGAAIGHQGQLIAIGQLALIIGAALLVAHRLAGIEGLAGGNGLAAVFPDLIGGQAERVPGVRLVEGIEQQGQAGGVIDINAQAQAAGIAAGVAVVAVAVGFQPGQAGLDIDRVVLGAIAQARAPEAVTADGRAVFQRRVERAFATETLDHTAGGIAIERGQRAA